MAKPSIKPGLIEADSRDRTKKSRRPKKTTVKKAPDAGEIKLKISDILDAFPFYVMLRG